MGRVPRNTGYTWQRQSSQPDRRSRFDQEGDRLAEQRRQEILKECGRLLEQLQSLVSPPREEQREIELLLGYAEVSKEGQYMLLAEAEGRIGKLRRLSPYASDRRYVPGCVRVSAR